MSNQTLDVASYQLQLRGVMLPIGLRLDAVDLQGVGLHLESDPFAAQVQRPGEMTVTVQQESLAAFLNAKAPAGLRDFDVSIQGQRLFIQGTKTMLIDVRATAVCTLRIVEGTKLFVDLESVDVLGGGALTNLVRGQIEALNPLFETDDLPVKATLRSIDADAGRVLLKGSVEP